MERTKSGLLVPARAVRGTKGVGGGLILPDHVEQARKRRRGKGQPEQPEGEAKTGQIVRVCHQCGKPGATERMHVIGEGRRQVLAYFHAARCLGKWRQATMPPNRAEQRAAGLRGYGKYSQHKRVGKTASAQVALAAMAAEAEAKQAQAAQAEGTAA